MKEEGRNGGSDERSRNREDEETEEGKGRKREKEGRKERERGSLKFGCEIKSFGGSVSRYFKWIKRISRCSH